MLTTVAREVRKRNPDAMIHVITKMPGVFERNPDVTFVSVKPDGRFRWQRTFQVRYGHHFPWKKHFLCSLCDCVGIRDRIDLRTYIYPQQQDWDYADKLVSELGAAPVLIVRTAGTHDGERKIWPVASWIRLVNQLANFAPVVDVGFSGAALALSGPQYRSILGQTSVHQLAALMRRARALVTVESGPNHLASAFDLPTVCILGGVFPPVAVHYPKTKVLANRPDCCDCWATKGCQRNLDCLSNITVEDVLKALDEISPDIRTHNAMTKQLDQQSAGLMRESQGTGTAGSDWRVSRGG